MHNRCTAKELAETPEAMSNFILTALFFFTCTLALPLNSPLLPSYDYIGPSKPTPPPFNPLTNHDSSRRRTSGPHNRQPPNRRPRHHRPRPRSRPSRRRRALHRHPGLHRQRYRRPLRLEPLHRPADPPRWLTAQYPPRPRAGRRNRLERHAVESRRTGRLCGLGGVGEPRVGVG